MNAVDTNVFVYALDADEPVKQVMPTAQVISTYFDLRARFSLSHWDSMLLAACKEAGVTTLFSEDMDPRTDYGGLTIVNPFV